MSAQIIPFQPARQEIAAENTLAATWGELWGEFFDLWGSACLETLNAARQTQLAYVAIMEQVLWAERRKEAEEYARLIREVCGES